jgi:helicase
MFGGWIDERTEEEIMEVYDITPGQLNMRIQNLEWLCYAGAELTRILRLRSVQLRLKRLETRVKYGVREELVPLVSVRGIGRVRARKLYNAGIKTVLQLKKTPKEELAGIIGLKTAEKVKKGLE